MINNLKHTIKVRSNGLVTASVVRYLKLKPR